MNAWILYAKEDSIKNQQFIDMFMEESKKHNVSLELVYVEDLYKKGIGEVPDFVISRMRDFNLAKKLEQLGTRVFNPSETIRIGNQKWETYKYLTNHNINCIPTKMCQPEELEDLIKSSNNPFVVKAVSGHGGSQVFLSTETTFQEMIQKIGNDQMIVQPYMAQYSKDVRVYVLGNKILAACERSCHGDFRANFSLGGSVRLITLTQEQERAAKEVMQYFDFALAGIDFLCNEKGEFVLNEIEDCVGSRMLYQVSDIQVVPLYFDYLLSQTRQKPGEGLS